MDKLGNFLRGVAASNEILQNAWKNGAFIECVCLESNQIDALLRIGLILKEQLKNENSEVNEKYLFQGESDSPISEKQIFQLAKEKGIIDEEIRVKLYSLYSRRNKVIHRYIISEITTRQVSEIALEYSKQKEGINAIIEKLEILQIELGIGMTKDGKGVPKKKVVELMSKLKSEKHGFPFSKGK